jgi:hypothetical protein
MGHMTGAHTTFSLNLLKGRYCLEDVKLNRKILVEMILKGRM